MTTTVKDVLGIVEKIAPFGAADSWDCSGLRIGSTATVVSKIAVSLDPSVEVIERAAKDGCNLLITHHPVAFKGLKNAVYDNNLDCKIIKAAFVNGVDVISCHTNVDNTLLNLDLAMMFGLTPSRPLEVVSEFGFGAGVFCESKTPVEVEKFCAKVAKVLNLSGYQLYGDTSEVTNISICGGSGGDLWKNVLDQHKMLYITADLDYHDRIYAIDSGVSVMLCDHGEMEEPPFKEFYKRLNGILPVESKFYNRTTNVKYY